jgi:hypothetical protein
MVGDDAAVAVSGSLVGDALPEPVSAPTVTVAAGVPGDVVNVSEDAVELVLPPRHPTSIRAISPAASQYRLRWITY